MLKNENSFSKDLILFLLIVIIIIIIIIIIAATNSAKTGYRYLKDKLDLLYKHTTHLIVTNRTEYCLCPCTLYATGNEVICLKFDNSGISPRLGNRVKPSDVGFSHFFPRR